jgi:hypothetical protein
MGVFNGDLTTENRVHLEGQRHLPNSSIEALSRCCCSRWRTHFTTRSRCNLTAEFQPNSFAFYAV